MTDITRSYVPAAGRDFALPLYDPLLKLFKVDAFRERAFASANIAPGDRVLDLGCGTGTLAIALKRKHPEARVTALDPDPKALAIAQQKARRAALQIDFVQGFAQRIPLADASVEHVVSSFMFHHLDAEQKRASLVDVVRVLRPGGVLHLLDFHDEHHHKSLIMRVLHTTSGALALRGQLEHQLEHMMEAAGFLGPRVERQRLFVFGSAAYYRAEVPR